MGSCGKKSSRKSTSGGHRSETTMKWRKGYSQTKRSGAGRNPFFLFLAHFRKYNRDRLCQLPSRQVALMAGRQWTRMSPTKKEPFIYAARRFSYTFRSRSKKVNWLLARLRESVASGESQAQALWMLMSSLKSWQQCVLIDRGKQEEEGCLN